MARIVVGVDGSDGAAEALRWTLGEARLRGADVRVVHAWSVPLVLSIPSADTFGVPEPAGSLEEVRTALRKEAERVLEASLVGVKADDIVIESGLAEGKAARVLIDAARDADLLVVGTRG